MLLMLLTAYHNILHLYSKVMAIADKLLVLAEDFDKRYGEQTNSAVQSLMKVSSGNVSKIYDKFKAICNE